MKSIFSESGDTISDDASVSNRRLSNSNILNVEENDDINEKRAKRKSLINEKVPKNIIMPNQKINLSNEHGDAGIHYGNCIKLASAGKINATNAFSLHLIDYLSEYVKELSHFQTVGSSLDAGTKIYAVRVDSVFTNTYQVLTGLGNPAEEKAPENVDLPAENPLSDDEVEGAGAGKQKKVKQRKNNSNKKTITQNYKKIRINPSQIRSEIDPLFQSQAENFDEGDISELRLNNLRLLDGTYELALDSEKIVYTNIAEEDSTTNEDEYSNPIDISPFLSMFKELGEGGNNIQMCEQFEDFTFCGWKPGNEIMNSTTAESFRNMMMQNTFESKLEEEENRKQDELPDCSPAAALCEPMEHDDYDNDNDGENFANNLEYSEILRGGDSAVKLEDEDDNLVTIGSNRTDNRAGEVLMSSVRDMVNSIVEQYGEVNDNILGMWAGPNYWKQKAKALKVKKVDTEKKPVAAKPPKEVKPIFPERIETRLNEDGIGRMVLNVDWKFTKNELVSTQLTDVCLNKNINKDYLLPPRTQFSLKSINQLMNREVSLVNKAFKKQTENIQQIELTEDDKVLNYDHNRANDILEIQPVILVTDDIGNITVNQDNFDDGFDNMPEDDLSDADAYTGTSFNAGDFNAIEQDAVTANVRRVEQIDIDYAKAAKRFDVKNLKSRMWSILKDRIGAVDVKTVHEKKYPDLFRSTKKCLFSELLVSLNGQLSAQQSADLSVPILLTCLLHLANETGLDIGNTDDYNDLEIGQGYSDYDIEQIKEFGVGNGLLDNSRKRNSAGCSGEANRRKKKISFLSEDNDDDDIDGDDNEDDEL